MSDFFSEYAYLIVPLSKVVVLLFITLTAVAYLTWLERRVVARIQSRLGPNRVGPHGLLQPLADGLKFLFKEDIEPAGVDRFVYYLAPMLALSLALTGLGVIPFGPGQVEILGVKTGLVVADVDISLIILFAVTSLGVYGVALGGWASNSKYPLLGGLRSSAQMISYEITLTLAVIGVILLSGSFSLREIVQAQAGTTLGFLPRWNIVSPTFTQVVGFFCFFTAAIAETNRVPFDLPEAETELVAGFHTEYSSFKFAMFFMAEYVGMISASCLATILFFGGWLSPLPEGAYFWAKYIPAVALGLAGLGLLISVVWNIRYYGAFVIPMALIAAVLLGAAAGSTQPGVMDVIQGPFWFLSKVFCFLFFYIWMRGTLPRFRYDQLMSFGWKFLLPVVTLNVFATAVAILLRHG